MLPSINHRSGSAPRKQRGFSLVELMVGALVGMIGIMAIMRAFELNETYKRSTGGTGQAQANGAIALFSLEREARMAGYGFNNPAALECTNIQWYFNGAYSSPPGGAGPGALPTLTTAPIRIEDGGGVGPDAITISYGTPDKRLIPTQTNRMPASSAEVKVEDNYGFSENDLFLIVQSGACVMYNATKLQNPANSDRIQRRPGAEGPFNPPGNGLFPDYTLGASVLNLGQLNVNRYDINNGDLRQTRLFAVPTGGGPLQLDNAPNILVNDIVDMRAYYGKDTNGDGQVDTWDKVVPTNAAGWFQVMAIRISLLARSGNYERPPTAASPCEATRTAPQFTANPLLSPNVAARYGNFIVPDGVPSCYKFRVFEGVVPIRNLIWRL